MLIRWNWLVCLALMLLAVNLLEQCSSNSSWSISIHRQIKSVRFSSLINDRKLRIVNVIKAKVIQQFQRSRMRHLIEEQLFTDYILFTNCQSRNEKLIKSEKTDYYYNNFKWLGFWPMWLYHCYFKFVLPVLTKHYYWKVVSLRIDKLSCLNFLKPENWYHISLTTKYMENKGMHSVFGSFKHVSASVIILIKCNYHFLGFLYFFPYWSKSFLCCSGKVVTLSKVLKRFTKK